MSHRPNNGDDSDSSIEIVSFTSTGKHNTRKNPPQAQGRTTRSASQKQAARTSYNSSALEDVIEIGSSSAEEDRPAPVPRGRRAAPVVTASKQPPAKRVKTTAVSGSSSTAPAPPSSSTSNSASASRRDRSRSQTSSRAASSKGGSSRSRSASRNVRKRTRQQQEDEEEEEETEYEQIVMASRRRPAAAASSGNGGASGSSGFVERSLRMAPRPVTAAATAMPTVLEPEETPEPEEDASAMAVAAPTSPSTPTPATRESATERRKMPTADPHPPADDDPRVPSSSPEPRPRPLEAKGHRIPSLQPPDDASRSTGSPEPRPRAIKGKARQAPATSTSTSSSAPAPRPVAKRPPVNNGDDSDDDFDIFARRGRTLNWSTVMPPAAEEVAKPRAPVSSASPSASSSQATPVKANKSSKRSKSHADTSDDEEEDEEGLSPNVKLSRKSGSKARPKPKPKPPKSKPKPGSKRSARKAASESEEEAESSEDLEFVPRSKRAKSTPTSDEPEPNPLSHQSGSTASPALRPIAATAKTPQRTPLASVLEEDESTPKASLEPEDLELQQWLAERRAKKGNPAARAGAAVTAAPGSPSKKKTCRLTVRTRVTPSYRSQRSARTVKKYEQSKVFTQPMDERLEEIGEWAKSVFKKEIVLECKGQRVYSLMLSPEALKWDESVQLDAYERSAYEEWQRQREEEEKGGEPSGPAVDAIEIDDEDDESEAEADAALSIASASDAGGDDDEVMNLTLRGAAGDVAVKAKATTKIMSLVKHYCTKHNITTPLVKTGRNKPYVALEVDGVPLDSGKTVGDYSEEIEDGDMLAVGTFKG